MTITDIIASVTIVLLPFWLLIPDTTLICGTDVWGVYFDNKIYVCKWDEYFMFYKYHEIGHHFYTKISVEQKKEYNKLYSTATDYYDDYSKTDVEEDFANNFSALQLKQNQKPNIQKRIRLIKKFMQQ